MVNKRYKIAAQIGLVLFGLVLLTGLFKNFNNLFL
jgi:hypothetical protein